MAALSRRRASPAGKGGRAVAELTEAQRRDLLIRNRMTHDGLWFAEVAAKYGMDVASPMNLRIEEWFDAMGLDFDRQPDLEHC
jgi:hypothetical protein